MTFFTNVHSLKSRFKMFFTVCRIVILSFQKTSKVQISSYRFFLAALFLFFVPEIFCIFLHL